MSEVHGGYDSSELRQQEVEPLTVHMSSLQILLTIIISHLNNS